MSKTIGGFMLVKDAITFDYCFIEAIESLLGFCDKVVVVFVKSNDDTEFQLFRLCKKHGERLIVTIKSEHEWNEMKGKEKLSAYQNMAIEHLKTNYQFLCQADEIVHEKSYSEIRKAVETGQEAFLCTRINLWDSPFTQLDVPLERMPCSKSVVRLTKTGFKTYDDGENIEANVVQSYFESGIRIYHMGFVRRRQVMKAKITNMQVAVFGMSEADSKLKECDIFNPKLWFSDEDLKPIDEPLPKIIQKWAKERYVED